MIDNNQTQNTNFSSPTTIIIIMLIFIIIILILFNNDTFASVPMQSINQPLTRYIKLPKNLEDNAVLNYPQNNNAPPTLSPNKLLTSKSDKTIYIVCQSKISPKTPYCLLDLGCMSINRNNITINGIKYIYNTPITFINSTIISCIINNGTITLNNLTTKLIDNVWFDIQSNLFNNNCSKVSIGKLLDNNNSFSGTINKVLIYNTVVTPKQHNEILLYLASNYKVQIPMDFTQINNLVPTVQIPMDFTQSNNLVPNVQQIYGPMSSNAPSCSIS